MSADLEAFWKAQMDQWAFDQRWKRAEALRAAARAKHAAGELDAASLAEWEIHAAELVLGYDLADLRGPIPDGWSTPTQIGHRLGVSAHRVGMAISELGLRKADPRLARRRVFERNGRSLVAWVYSAESERLLRDHFTGR
ncbi:MAG: hypothetical protein H6735_00015 [Alphaproteobacteria bacterium]|nr:hypothetical protein [Alphaproteobacteria bacterium]